VLFIIDEDVDQAVGAFLASTHQVRYAVDLFGTQTKDAVIRSWARANDAVIVTGDNELARSCRQRRRAALIHLKDLGTEELVRVASLLNVIEAEASIQGTGLWIQIGTTQFVVAR
jgi:predicted nuclease of predicted toxin-antitoxin system